MQRRKFILGAAASTLAAAAARAEDGFKPLYNGKDLAGWHVESGKIESWRANGEMISCVLPGGGYLAADKEYADFELRLEYRIPPAGNTGVGLRFPKGGWPSTMGMEIQILDDAAPQYKSLTPEHLNGSIYSFVAAKAKPAKPAGEWNSMAIRCKGPQVVIHINGVEIQNVNLDQQTQKGKGDLPLDQRPRKGLIGLQSHGDPVDFRNVRLREL